MDPRLVGAAQRGDVNGLNDLIRGNALSLEETALKGAGHTPLHVACVTGHLNIVLELLKSMIVTQEQRRSQSGRKDPHPPCCDGISRIHLHDFSYQDPRPLQNVVSILHCLACFPFRLLSSSSLVGGLMSLPSNHFS